MKTIIKNIFKTLALLTVYCLVNTAHAQAPNKMSYQAVVRNGSNVLVANTLVSMRISVLDATATGTAVYVETLTTTTNVNGLATIEIGGGTPVTGTFAGINWANGLKFIKIDIDPTGGTNFSITSTSQLMSVPYALSSADNKWTQIGNDISTTNTGNVGIGTADPQNKLDINYLGGTTGIRLKSTDGFAVFDIDASNGDAAIRFRNAGVARWVIRNSPVDNNFQIFTSSPGAFRFTILSSNGNVGIGSTVPTAKLEVDGFTKLGTDAPAVKFKKLVGTTAATQGGQILALHNLNSLKILSTTVLVEYGAGVYAPPSSGTGYEFNFIVNTTGVFVQNAAANSSLILGKPFKIMITYEE